MNDFKLSSLTNEQEIFLSILLVFSATLSVIGSSTIIYKVIHNRKKATPYDRLMLALSACDVVASFTYGSMPFLMSVEEPNHRAWSIGNTGSCATLGFLSQFSFSAVFYNCMLSYYYLLTVRLGVKRKQFAERYEIPMHVFTIAYFLATATIGAFFGMYSGMDVGFGCWVNNYPKGCIGTDSCMSPIIGLIFGAGPTVVTFLSLIINNLMIYVYVQSNLNNNTVITKTKKLTTTGNDSVDDYGDEVSLSEANAQPENDDDIKIESNNEQPSSFDLQRKKRTQEVAIQGMLYVLTFAFSYTPAFVVRVMEAFSSERIDDSNIYPLMMLIAVSLPLQGFFNMFVYNRPSYSRVRKMHPELSIFKSIRMACFDSTIPKVSDISMSTETKSKIKRKNADKKKKKRERQLWSREKKKFNNFFPNRETEDLTESNFERAQGILSKDAAVTAPYLSKQQRKKRKVRIDAAAKISSWGEISLGIDKFSIGASDIGKNSWGRMSLGFSRESLDIISQESSDSK